MLEKANKELLNLAYDSQFKTITGLTWFPWVGKYYDNPEHRLLIIGESHYCENHKVEETKADYELTRNVVQHYGVTRKNCNRMFDNLLRCLFQTVNINREKLWQEVAFYNFIQRPMETISQRPNEEDIQKGWSVFVEVFKILKPTYCLFVGVSAANQLSKNISSMNIPYEPVKWERACENLRRWARLFSIGGDLTQCVAIQHTSHHFSWKRWHEFFANKEKQLLDCFDFYNNKI